MTARIVHLLATPTTERAADAYEAMFDEFIGFAGGQRVSAMCVVPVGKQNADYHITHTTTDLLLELKQIAKYDSKNTVDRYFSDLLRQGKVKSVRDLGNGKVQIDPSSLTNSDWHRFYRKFRPSVEKGLREAANQLKDTMTFIPCSEKRHIKGVVFLNSGDFNLPTNLLYRLVERKAKLEWKQGNFKSIDFVSCFTVDMYTSTVHPLHSRHIARSTNDAEIVSAVHHLVESWLSYFATAFGMTVEKLTEAQSQESRLELSQPFGGKIQWIAP